MDLASLRQEQSIGHERISQRDPCCTMSGLSDDLPGPRTLQSTCRGDVRDEREMEIAGLTDS